MEFKVIKEPVAVNEVICDSFTELPIECDMLLPDYCPDMTKILKCCVSPVFTESTVEGNSLTAEGHFHIELYYLSDSRQVRCCENKVPFSKVIDLKCSPDAPAISLDGAVEYVNCRAINQRRVDIRGAMTMSAKVAAQKNEELVADASGGGIQLRRNTWESICLAGTAQRQFTVREDLELSQGKPAIGHIIRRQVGVAVTDQKVIQGKIILKGDLLIQLFYLSAEDSSPETMEYTLPISQIIDVAGVEEGCRCDVRLRVAGSDIQPKSDLDGETTMLSAEITLQAEAKAYRSCRTTGVSDAYSTAFESQMTERPITAMGFAAQLDDRHAYKEELELPEEATSILTMWCDAVYAGCRQEEGQARLMVKMNLCMFALDGEGTPVYFEKPVELEHAASLPADAENLFADVLAQAGECRYSMTGGGVEVSCEIMISGLIFSVAKRVVVSDLSLDESKPQEQDGSTALTIYFAGQGESVWDIAKRYHTSMAAVMDENAIEQEVLPARATLLIPMVG